MANPIPSFLAHKQGDHVAVAVRDVSPGAAEVGFLDGTDQVVVEVNAEIPLGHKVALRDLSEGDEVIEYGVRTAIVSAAISEGDYVHIHNVRSARWHNSVA
jgi:(2R)-sulfolactate sulfo-lyase subunit alpha